MSLFKKILVCNRGEIAVRIIRGCNELGIRTVAIFSETDQFALHRKLASEAYCLGKEPLQTYLKYDDIIRCAKASGCDAIHPGYGFLSENAAFALACEKAGLIFIGPKASVIKTMGSKILARKAMVKAGIPVIPGSLENLTNIEAALRCANKIGYPVMLKATFGGGGRGIRVCAHDKELQQQFSRVQSEAGKAFGDTHVFIEKYIRNPRHIEVQILADNHGQTLHLYERDCSIQRRHQKLVEIAPAPNLHDSIRLTLYDYALKAARSVGYTNAGTVEFILDDKEQIFFLEMNTRLQVEHPITEAITGIDLVREQIHIAAGKALSFCQQDIQRHGVAIEFRINAEDPQNRFLPGFGRISRYVAPGGPGVRTDSAVYTGYTIPAEYDSLCAKLTVWALDWEGVLSRARSALEEITLLGIKTTIPYYLNMVNSDVFSQGRIHTGLIEEHPQWLSYDNPTYPAHQAAAIAAAIAAYNE